MTDSLGWGLRGLWGTGFVLGNFLSELAFQINLAFCP